jgi:hypothetical protein
MPNLKLYFYFELAAFICAVLCFKQLKQHKLTWLTPYLFLMVALEFITKYLRTIKSINTTFIFNFSIPFEYLFYTALIYFLVKKTYLKTLIAIIFFSVLFFSLYNLLFVQSNIKLLATYNLKFGNLCMIILCCISLYDVFETDIEKPITSKPLFWLSFGVLFFNLGEFMYFSFINTLLKNNWDTTMSLFKNINNSLIILLYSFISISILCTKNIQKSR